MFKCSMTQSRLIHLSNSPFSSICNPNVHLNQLHSRKSTIITCARTNKLFLLRSKRSNKTLIQLARFAASNLHYVLPLPPPLDSVVRDFGNGGGGGGGGRSGGFGWGGFDGGGRKRRVNKKSKLGFWVLVIGVCCFLGFWWLNLNLGKVELKGDVALGLMCCLSMFLVLVRNGFVPEWVLGFCGGGFAAGLAFEKKDELRKLFGIGLKGMGVSRRRRGRRAI